MGESRRAVACPRRLKICSGLRECTWRVVIASVALSVAVPGGAQTYPARPVRVVVPFAEARTLDHVSRRPARADGVQPPGFIRVAAQKVPAYPDRPVRVIVPFAPGGGSDFVAREVSAKLSGQLAQQFVVDNRGGAGGMIGIELTAKAPPDGYIIMIMSASFSATAATNRPGFDPINTIVGVAEIGFSPFVLMMHPSLPARNVKELIALAAAKPGQIIYASSGIGSVTHLATELIASMAKITMIHVPYKGVAPALTDLLAGQVHFTFGSYPTAEGHIKSGRLRALAVTGAKRSTMLPDLPAIAETLPGYNVELWFGVMAPRGTPPGVIERLNSAVNKILVDPEMKKNLDSQGMTPSGGPPEKFGERIRRDYDRWVKVIKAARIKVE